MENTRSIFKLNKKITIGLLIVLALALPFVINQVLQRQDTRQRADSAPAVTIKLGPPTPGKIGDTISTKVFIDSNSNDIGSVHFEVEGAENFPEITVTPSSSFQAIVQKIIPYGAAQRYSFTGVNTAINPNTGSNVEVATISFKGTTAGYFALRLRAIEVTAGRYDTFVPLSTTTAPSVTVQVLSDGSADPQRGYIFDAATKTMRAVNYVPGQNSLNCYVVETTTCLETPTAEESQSVAQCTYAGTQKTVYSSVNCATPTPSATNTPVPSVSTTPDGTDCAKKPQGDFNCNTTIGFDDLFRWRDEYISGTGTTADVKEPAGVGFEDLFIWRDSYIAQ